MAQVYSNCRTPRQGSKVDRHPSIFPSGTGSRHPSLKFSGTGTGTLDTADKEMLVAGGDDGGNALKSTDIALLK